MLGMKGVCVLKLEMNERSSQLDQPLVEGVIRSLPSILQPEMLQHIMRFIIPLRVEAFEIAEIAGINPRLVPQVLLMPSMGESESFYEELDAFGLVHRPAISRTRESYTSKEGRGIGCDIGNRTAGREISVFGKGQA